MKQSVIQKLRNKFRSASNQHQVETIDETCSNLWFKASLNREQAEAYILPNEIGTFVIRKSESILDCHVLSVKVPKYVNITEISHYLIVKSKRGYSVRGFSKEFNDLKSLVTHCAFMRDMLPVLLNLDFYKSQLKQNEFKSNDFFYYSSSTSSLASTMSSSSLDSSFGSQ